MHRTSQPQPLSSSPLSSRTGVEELRVLTAVFVIVTGLVIAFAPPPMTQLVWAQTGGSCDDPENPCSGPCCPDVFGDEICCDSGDTCCQYACCSEECIDNDLPGEGEICCPEGSVGCGGSCCSENCLDVEGGGNICCPDGQIECDGECCDPEECCDLDGDGEGDHCGYLCTDNGGNRTCHLCTADDGDNYKDYCYTCDHDSQIQGNDDCYRCDFSSPNDSTTPNGVPDSCYKCDTDGDGDKDHCYGKSTTDSDTKTYSRGNDDTSENIYETASHSVTAKVVSGGATTTRHATVTISYSSNLTGNPADPQAAQLAAEHTVVEDGNPANHNGSGTGGTLTITKNDVWGDLAHFGGTVNIAYWPNRPNGTPGFVQQNLSWSAHIDDCGKVTDVWVTLVQNPVPGRDPNTPLNDTTEGAAGYPAYPGTPRNP